MCGEPQYIPLLRKTDAEGRQVVRIWVEAGTAPYYAYAWAGSGRLTVGEVVPVPWETFAGEPVIHDGRVVGLGSDWRGEFTVLR